MNREEVVKYLRTQAYWINQLANEVESGGPVTCEWCVDLDLPKVETISNRVVEREVKTA